MNSTNQIGFISTRIRQLKNAVLHTHSNDVLNLPDITVHAIDVDKGGYVWFTILKPEQPIHEATRSFYVALNFYRNSLPFFLNISGIARLVTSTEEILALPVSLQKKISADRLMVSVKIRDVGYYEHEPNQPDNWFQKCKNIWAKVFEPEPYYALAAKGQS